MHWETKKKKKVSFVLSIFALLLWSEIEPTISLRYARIVFGFFRWTPKSGISELYLIVPLLFFSIPLTIVAAPIYIPTNSEWRWLFPHILTNNCWVFGDSHSDRCEVILHCGLDCISLMISDVEHLFLLAVYVSFG